MTTTEFNIEARWLELFENKKLLAHPQEPSYPCCISALGEFTRIAPREEPSTILAHKPGSRQARGTVATARHRRWSVLRRR